MAVLGTHIKSPASPPSDLTPGNDQSAPQEIKNEEEVQVIEAWESSHQIGETSNWDFEEQGERSRAEVFDTMRSSTLQTDGATEEAK